MNIVMVDSGQLSGDADFPEVNIDKYGWLQFVELDEQEVEERCWRADVIVSANTPITAQVIKESYKCQLIIAAGDSTEHIDKDAANARGITILNVPGVQGDTAENTQTICNQVVEHINHWLEKQTENDGVDQAS